MGQFDVARYGDLLIAARAAGAQQLPTPSVLPQSAAEAYAVQDHVLGGIGPAAAWKVGAATPTTTPTCAPILSTGFNTRDGRTHARGHDMGIELEIAFRLARDFPRAATAPDAQTVREAVEGAYIAIETCVPRHAEGLKAPPLLSLADSGINHGLHLGPRIDAWAAIDAKTLAATVEIDDKAVAETTGGHTHGDILALLVWQVGHCVTMRGGLTRGTVITTGSWMGIVWSKVPARVRGTFAGIGSMDLALLADTGANAP